MARQIDLSKYETVKERKKRFYADHKDGRIIVELINAETILDHALFKASVFINDTCVSSGYAHEIRDKEKSVSKYGKEYESVNYSSWVENCEESAIGRALDNYGYAGNDKCSREEMKKVQNYNDRSLNKPAPEHPFTKLVKSGIPKDTIIKYVGEKYKIDIDKLNNNQINETVNFLGVKK